MNPAANERMKIALASPRVPTSIDDGLEQVHRLMADAAARGAAIVCFPENYVPGLRGVGFDVPPFEPADEARVIDAVGRWAGQLGIATILGAEHVAAAGRQIAAFVFDARGTLQGIQAKTQLDPTENWYYVPGESRRMFEVDGLRFGIAICHEGFRYPETVRWAATRGAKIVFHPHCAVAERECVVPTEWGAKHSAYYEKAMMMRSIENTIYFASVNYALQYPESATSVIDPSGRCVAYLPYGQEGVLIEEIDLDKATGLIAKRFAPERYLDSILDS
jgi:predicted amidohydrolase